MFEPGKPSGLQDYSLEDLIDIPLLQSLQEKLNVIYSFPSAIIDNNGKILTAVAWQDICTKYHRLHPQCLLECIKSDRFILEHLHEANPAVSYQCPHGLVDNATPIVIDGKHLGNFFTGQFFLEKPDLDFFKQQAKTYGFDEDGYLEAVRNVPVWTRDRLSQYLDFIKGFIEIIAGIGLNHLNKMESSRIIKESNERYLAIIQSTTDWIWEVDEFGRYRFCSPKVEKILGYTVDEIIGKTPFDLMPAEEVEHIKATFHQLIATKSLIVDLENWNIHKDGHKVCLLTNGFPILDGEGKLTGYRGSDKDITERKQEEEKIANERKRLSAILNGTNSGSWEWNIQTGETVYNERWAEIIGYTLAEISPVSIETWIQFAHPEDLILSRKLLEIHFNRESDFYELETRMRHKNGDWIWVFDRGQVHAWDKDGKPHLMSGTHVDITQRKKAEIALRESEARLAEAQKIAKFGSWETDLTNLNVIWSDEIFHIFGIVPSTFQPTHPGFLTFVHPDDRVKVDEAFIVSFDKQSFNTIEHRIITPGGFVKFVEERWRIFHDDQGIATRAVGTCQDISERKMAEAEILRLNERISIATRSAQVAIWEFDIANNRLIWDEQMCTLYGKKKEEFKGNYDAWLKTLHPDDVDRSIEEVNKVVTGEKDYDTEFRVVWTDGSLHYLKSKAHNIRDTNGKPLRIIGVSYDITKEKESEYELLKAKECAEEGDRLKTAFLANMSHEIRTPMNGILGFAGLLKEQKLTGEEQAEYISIIERSGVRMLNIINDIVDISKIESGQMNISFLQTNINEQIGYIYSFFRQEAEQKGLQLLFKKSLPAKKAVINTDREKVYAILTNLIKNAIKFTPAGTVEFGYILDSGIETTLEVESNHTAQTTDVSSLLTFFVRDTGIGIPEDRQDAIFDRFVQADIGDTRAYQGAGLGLSISKAYVEMLGGRIWVKSTVGKGSCFCFTLPYNHQPNESELISENSSTIGAEPHDFNLNILVAEDDETSEKLIRLGLKKYTKSIETVNTGVDAVERCRNNPAIDLVLMDIKMPEMDGYEATRQIRQFNHDVIIFAQTAYALVGDREKAIAAGCNDYLTKPISREILDKLIKKYF
jgi:PAS domain S-box-containing protein